MTIEQQIVAELEQVEAAASDFIEHHGARCQCSWCCRLTRLVTAIRSLPLPEAVGEPDWITIAGSLQDIIDGKVIDIKDAIAKLRQPAPPAEPQGGGEGDVENYAETAEWCADIMDGNGKYSERDALRESAKFIRTQAATIASLRAENERLRSLQEVADRMAERLKDYGAHDDCGMFDLEEQGNCTCGHDQLLADYAKWKETT